MRHFLMKFPKSSPEESHPRTLNVPAICKEDLLIKRKSNYWRRSIFKKLFIRELFFPWRLFRRYELGQIWLLDTLYETIDLAEG